MYLRIKKTRRQKDGDAETWFNSLFFPKNQTMKNIEIQ